MLEKHLDIETPDGAMNTFAVYPEEKGPHPVVLFYMDAPGKREELHDMAQRLAAAGYRSARLPWPRTSARPNTPGFPRSCCARCRGQPGAWRHRGRIGDRTARCSRGG